MNTTNTEKDGAPAEAAAPENTDPEQGSTEAVSAPEVAAEPSDAEQAADSPDAQASGDEEVSSTPEADEAPSEEPEGPDPERVAADAARIRALFAVDAVEGQDADAPTFRLARWSRPIAPRVYGASEDSAEAAIAAIAEVCVAAGAPMSDPQAEDAGEPNFLVYVCEEWSALQEAPGLAAMEPDLEALLAGLAATNANQHRFFKVSRSEGVVLAVTLLRLDGRLEAVSAQAAALGQAVRGVVLWSDAALSSENPIALRRSGKAALKGWFARLLAAIYAEGTPAFSEDPALADALALSVAKPASRKAAGDEDREAKGKKRKRRRKRSDEASEEASASPQEASTTEATEAEAEGAASTESEEAEKAPRKRRRTRTRSPRKSEEAQSAEAGAESAPEAADASGSGGESA